jgi:outer membrane lipoprotein-sorting protein
MKELLFITMFLLPSWLSLKAQDYRPVSDRSALEEKISGNATSIRTVQSDFRQVKHMTFMEEDIISAGKFYLSGDDHLRWEYTDPFEYVIVLNGERIMVRDGDKLTGFDASRNAVLSGISKVLSGIASGTLFRNSEFRTSYFQGATDYLLVLEPAQGPLKAFLEQVELYIGKQDLSVMSVRLSELSGDFTLITFTNKILNAEIPSSFFDLH